MSPESPFPTSDGDSQDKIGKESPPIEPYGPVPSNSQLAWQDAEMAMFCHFGTNTFTGEEWGDGTDSASLFAPTGLDVRQWVEIAHEVGFKSIVFTAKHLDGFCLWPSKYTNYTIARSPYKNGNGDVVKELAAACSDRGIGLGIYLAPCDMHERTYRTDAYNHFFGNQLTELLGDYGPIVEVWFDGALPEGPKRHTQTMDWELIFSTVRSYQPEALIAILGPDIRWVGNEVGIGSETEWCIQPHGWPIQIADAKDRVWFPSECNVSIRPGWFYKSEEDALVKTVEQLTDMYIQTVGRNSNLLLNVPPNQQGVISDVDVQRLRAWRKRLDDIFAQNIFRGQTITATSTKYDSSDYSPANCLDENRKTFWAAEHDTTTAELIITLSKTEWINIVRLEEAIQYGQRIESFSLFYDDGSSWINLFKGTTIGRTRIVTFPAIQTNRVKIAIEASLAAPTLRVVNGYCSPLIHP